jgi:hypothetical protein
MLRYVFQAFNTDYATAEEAIAAVEDKGSGRVVKFMMERNLPNCLPEYVHRSIGLWSYQDGKWFSHYIYDGRGDRLAEEKPH